MLLFSAFIGVLVRRMPVRSNFQPRPTKRIARVRMAAGDPANIVPDRREWSGHADAAGVTEVNPGREDGLSIPDLRQRHPVGTPDLPKGGCFGKQGA
jgi:hypothetical protein